MSEPLLLAGGVQTCEGQVSEAAFACSRGWLSGALRLERHLAFRACFTSAGSRKPKHGEGLDKSSYSNELSWQMSRAGLGSGGHGCFKRL